MKLPISKWTLHCTNPSCGYCFESAGAERDVICKRCGGFVEITERINFIETEDKEE
jgi:rRNA maturation endonuclease Nob1